MKAPLGRLGCLLGVWGRPLGLGGAPFRAQENSFVRVGGRRGENAPCWRQKNGEAAAGSRGFFFVFQRTAEVKKDIRWRGCGSKMEFLFVFQLEFKKIVAGEAAAGRRGFCSF